MAVQGQWIFRIAAVLSLFFSPAPLIAGDSSIARQSLRNLDGIYASVEPLGAEIEKLGLTNAAILGDVKSQLRKAGIRILTKEKWFEAEGNPYLYVNAHIMALPASKEFIYSVYTAFKQNAYPVREPVEIIGATTWTTGSTIGITGNLDKIRSAVGSQVDKFIEAYFSVNPR